MKIEYQKLHQKAAYSPEFGNTNYRGANIGNANSGILSLSSPTLKEILSFTHYGKMCIEINGLLSTLKASTVSAWHVFSWDIMQTVIPSHFLVISSATPKHLCSPPSIVYPALAQSYLICWHLLNHPLPNLPSNQISSHTHELHMRGNSESQGSAVDLLRRVTIY